MCKRENFSNSSVCDGCNSILPFNDKSICGNCGRATAYPTEYCDICKNKPTNVDMARSAFEYLQPISTLIMRYKYGGEKYLREYFAQKLMPVFLKYIGYADCIVYVPMTKSRIKQRGYNQSKVLAEEFSKLVEIPVVDALEKTKETYSQVGLTLKERTQNLKGSFKVVDRGAIKGKRALLIDDVLTTDSTANAVAEKLKSAGAEEVICLTVASVNFKKPIESDEKDRKSDSLNEDIL